MAAALPRVPHELQPDTWPQPDYLAEALRVAGGRPDDAYATVRVRREPDRREPAVVVLPVQTQAFAFGPAFRALVGAELDRQLAAAGVQATEQVDVVGVDGPYVRRLPDTSVRSVIDDHPGQAVLSLSIGHDGIDHAFVDLGMQRDRTLRSVHRRVDLPEAPLPALAAIAAAMTDALRELNVVGAVQPKLPIQADIVCTDRAWDVGAAAPADDGERACLALVVGSLLPNYETRSIVPDGMSPASRLAWLARAYTIASHAGTSAGAGRIGELSLRQLGIAPTDPGRRGDASGDAVTGRVETLLLLKDTKAAPVRSARDLRDRQIEAAIDGLPAYASALFVARARFADPFSAVDLCSIVQNFPAMSMATQRGCEAPVPAGGSGPRRAASVAEGQLLQEWQLAATYKSISDEGLTQGNSERARAMLAALPTGMATHPFMQRLRFRIEQNGAPPARESFDELLARLRSQRLAFVQSTVELQRNDAWMAAMSVTDHVRVPNMNIEGDAQMRAASNLESRLLSVMRYDRFGSASDSFMPMRRQQGEPASFLVPPAPAGSVPPIDAAPPMFRRGAFGGVFPTSPASASAPAWTPVFRLNASNLYGMPPTALEATLSKNPGSMDTRARVAINRLKQGGSVADAVALFEAYPADARTDNDLAKSFRWAAPAHVLFLSGEPAASRQFYERVRAIGSGSEADLIARVRLGLIDGHLDAALQSSRFRLERYGSDWARADTVGMLFMQGRSDTAWPLFLDHAQTSQLLNLWDGAAVGHRMQRLGLADIQRWLAAQDVGKTQIANVDVTGLYLHRMAVTDRRPTEADIELLRNLPGASAPNTRWAMSATLAAAALGSIDPAAAVARVDTLAAQATRAGDYAFLLPLYAWVSAQAGAAADESVLSLVRQATIDADFDRLLAKALLLAATGDTQEALRFLRAARFELGHLAWGDNGLAGRPVLPQFEYARAAYLMYRKTGDAAIRDEANAYAHAVETAWPYFTWSYGLELATEAKPRKGDLARCRAAALDADSYFLAEALRAAPGRAPPCPARLW